MRGTPGGFQTRQGQGIDPANVVAISVYVYQPGGKCEYTVSELRAGGSPVFPLPKNLDGLFPMIDRFGQYIHKDWPGKTHGEDDLAAARKQEAADLAAHPGPQAWNQYGGWLAGPKLEATGRFRVAKWRDKWWFVDPEGRLFWSHGLVRVTWSCGYTPITGRERLFAELAERDSPFGAFYGRSTWAIAGLYERGAETYNFSGANLLRKYGPNWQADFADLVHRRLRSWGLNTMANCSQPAIYLERKTPYTATVYSLDSPPEDTPGATGYVATIHDDSRVIEATSGGWGKFPDVFDPSFKAVLLKEVAQHKGKAVGDPWCLGYFPGNELNWGADETALARAALASPADQPAKRALVDQLKAKYETIEKLNAAWKTSYTSWEALVNSTTPPGPEQGREDLAAFLGTIADAYFRQCREAIKEIDPEGLYLGCRFAGWSHGVVFRTAAKYSDVVSVNRYTETLADFRLPDGIDKPVVIGEWHFGLLDRGKFHASLRPVPNQQARGEAYETSPARWRTRGSSEPIGISSATRPPPGETTVRISKTASSTFATRPTLRRWRPAAGSATGCTSSGQRRAASVSRERAAVGRRCRFGGANRFGCVTRPRPCRAVWVGPLCTTLRLGADSPAAVDLGQLDREAPDFAVERAGVDSQILGGLLAISLAPPQRLRDQELLHCLQAHRPRFVPAGACRRAQLRRKVLQLDTAAAAEDERLLDDVLQLADISRIIVFHQPRP